MWFPLFDDIFNLTDSEVVVNGTGYKALKDQQQSCACQDGDATSPHNAFVAISLTAD